MRIEEVPVVLERELSRCQESLRRNEIRAGGTSLLAGAAKKEVRRLKTRISHLSKALLYIKKAQADTRAEDQ